MTENEISFQSSFLDSFLVFYANNYGSSWPLWFLYFYFPLYILLLCSAAGYWNQVFYGEGRLIMPYVGSRRIWWLSQCIYGIIHTFLYFILFFTALYISRLFLGLSPAVSFGETGRKMAAMLFAEGFIHKGAILLEVVLLPILAGWLMVIVTFVLSIVVPVFLSFSFSVAAIVFIERMIGRAMEGEYLVFRTMGPGGYGIILLLCAFVMLTGMILISSTDKRF